MRPAQLLAGWAVALALAGCAGAPADGPAAGLATTREPLRAEAGHARRLLVRRCQNCHVIPDPRKYDEATWRRNLDQMRKRVRLREADWDSLEALVRAPDSLAGLGRPGGVVGS